MSNALRYCLNTLPFIVSFAHIPCFIKCCTPNNMMMKPFGVLYNNDPYCQIIQCYPSQTEIVRCKLYTGFIFLVILEQ